MPPSPAADAVDALAAEIWAFQLAESPVRRTYLGIGGDDDRLDTGDAEARSRRREAIRGFLERHEGLDVPEEGSEAWMTWRILRRQLRDGLEAHEHRGWEHDVDQLFGLHLQLQNLMSVQPLGDEDAWARLEARLRDVPRAMGDHVQDLRDGIASGRLPPRLVVDRVIGQLRAFADTADAETPFVAVPATRTPAAWDDARRDRWLGRLGEAVAEAVRPAYLDYLRFLERDLRPVARESVGLRAIPGGEATYAFRVRTTTTTDLTPDEIHAIGQEELAKNKAEMLVIAREQGHDGDLASYLASLHADDAFRLPTREAILERYRAICARMDDALPRVFGRLPRTGYEIRPVEAFREKDAPAAFYQRPPQDGSRPGVFYANTHDPASWPTYDFEPLCFHEAVPGHHLQIALAQEIEGLPALRRHGGFTAYVEGWAHYTERLADEMEMYSTPHDRIGMLSAQAWRAARLVVDTGLHHLGWTRAQAIEVMRSIRAGNEADVLNEVDRYISWPGQALAYKVGSRRITEIREACRERLGEAFDLRAFHDEILRHGALPLALLDEVMRAWTPAA